MRHRLSLPLHAATRSFAATAACLDAGVAHAGQAFVRSIARSGAAGSAYHRHEWRRPEPGFTLIELLVVISVAAILFALGVPGFRESTLRNQRAARSNELVSTLNYARSQALALRRPVIVCRTRDPAAATPSCGTGSGWEEGWVVFQEITVDNTVTDETEILRRQAPLLSASQLALPATGRLTVRGNNNLASRVRFNVSGATANNGTLMVCDQRGFPRGRAIVVAATGRVQSFDAYGRQGGSVPDPRLPARVTGCLRS